ncbi:class I SAM-dependent methyltransferase [Streptomyces litchfieldiae]|uniref:Class I SAM-dependent methyltransferase n=1 Tax=Streptomyces litchfieldiae TaxID=3075543 RepID=A0ABU2MQW4_9ACTN|nr:class I SAM-dependent methyltransferase [Streptomyces sp. DSM 44938]MDT0344006.1 class I SAM-dependent methyltransferase [Streptomyces sp. DSM 44938]
MSVETDPYAVSAPFIDPLIAGFWEGVAPSLTAELTGLTAGSGPVVDLGAGSGRGVRVIGTALPGVPVVAVEPSAAMRTALFARLVDDPGLAARTTVVAADALAVELPAATRAVVAMNVLGHLAPAERARLWRRVAERLAPGGALLVNNQPPHAPSAVPLARGNAFRVGDHDYEGWVRAEPAGEDRILWHMTYKTLQGGRCVAEVAVDYDWWVVTDERLRAEWSAHGPTARVAGTGPSAFHVVTAAPDGAPAR